MTDYYALAIIEATEYLCKIGYYKPKTDGNTNHVLPCSSSECQLHISKQGEEQQVTCLSCGRVGSIKWDMATGDSSSGPKS